MPGRCPVCGQSLPDAINQNELQVRIQKLATPALAAEKRKLKEEFDNQLATALEASRASTERRFERELRTAEARAQKDAELKLNKQLLDVEKRAKVAEARAKREVDQARKDAESCMKKEAALIARNLVRENEHKIAKIQNDREKEKVRYEAESARLQGKLEALSRKLERQSGEQLGADAEFDLYSELKRSFPEDRVERIGKGVKGADIVHEVREGARTAGRIIYESKNTLSWQNDFITQAKKYKTQYETPHVIIVTRVFPSKSKGLCVVKEIPIVDKRMAVALACVIREGIIEIAKLHVSGQSSDEKSQELYRYIASDKFTTRFKEIADCVASLREQQHKERIWHENAWQIGSKTHERMEGRHREVEAQIRAIVRGNSRKEGPRPATSSENWQRPANGIRQVQRG